MAENEVVETKTPQQEYDDKFAADEARRKAQANFDPKIHGVGTTPVMAPESVAQLWKVVDARLSAIERTLKLKG